PGRLRPSQARPPPRPPPDPPWRGRRTCRLGCWQRAARLLAARREQPRGEWPPAPALLQKSERRQGKEVLLDSITGNRRRAAACLPGRRQRKAFRRACRHAPRPPQHPAGAMAVVEQPAGTQEEHILKRFADEYDRSGFSKYFQLFYHQACRSEKDGQPAEPKEQAAAVEEPDQQ
ncbi:unnamed protein product, partial [Prorocentrum cordatum]